MLLITLNKFAARPEYYPFPVISVGNITAGGTGKTPMVLHLSEKLRNCDYEVVILSSAAGKAQKNGSHSERDDELRMLREKLQGIRIRPKNRDNLRVLKESQCVRKIAAVIDDGFHTHNIGRDIDILMIDAANPFDNRLVIPSGLLREPASAIRRADVFILSHPYMVSRKQLDSLAFKLKRLNKPVYIMDYEITGLKNEKSSLPFYEIAGREVTAIAGIGNPFNFFALMSGLGTRKIHAFVYPDHFSYRRSDIKKILSEFRKNGTSHIITTEKDYTKLKMFDEELPLFYLEIKSRIDNFYEMEDFDTFMLSMLK